MIGLNVGSGQRPFTSTPEISWVNVDSQARWNPDVLCNAEHLPYPDGTVDCVVLHHVLEHFGCGEAESLIAEAHRVLKPRGSLLVFVPDLQALAKKWMDGGLSTQIYVTNLYGAYMGSEDDRHKWGFTFNSLYDFLRDSAPKPWYTLMGFDWRKIPGADIAQDFWIIGMEARK